MWPGTPKKKAKGDGRKDKREEAKFLSYDAFASSSSSGALTSEQAFKQAVQTIVQSGKIDFPDDIKNSFQEDPMMELKSEQQQLNKRRKILAKIERLKGAQANKAQAWSTYKEELMKSYRREQEKQEKDQKEIAEAMLAAQEELNRLEAGEVEEKMEAPDVADLIFAEKDAEKDRLAAELAQAKEDNHKQQQAMLQLQMQMNALSAQISQQPVAKIGEATEERIINLDEKEKERQARLKRIEQVEQAKKKQELQDRERSPRRESQGSQEMREHFDSLGWDRKKELQKVHTLYTMICVNVPLGDHMKMSTPTNSISMLLMAIAFSGRMTSTCLMQNLLCCVEQVSNIWYCSSHARRIPSMTLRVPFSVRLWPRSVNLLIFQAKFHSTSPGDT